MEQHREWALFQIYPNDHKLADCDHTVGDIVDTFAPKRIEIRIRINFVLPSIVNNTK